MFSRTQRAPVPLAWVLMSSLRSILSCLTHRQWGDFDPTRRWLVGGPEGGSEVQRATRPIPTSLDWPLLTLEPASRKLHASPSPSAPRVWGSPSIWVTGGPSGSPG